MCVCVCVCVCVVVVVVVVVCLFVCLFVREDCLLLLLLFLGGGRLQKIIIVIVYSKATVTRVANRNKLFCIKKDRPAASSFSGCVTNSLSRARQCPRTKTLTESWRVHVSVLV